MFGAFKPSAPLSGGLLWKIPWRLSAPQKLRHRRRLRRVDNVVTVLDSALKRSAATTQIPQSNQKTVSPSSSHNPDELSIPPEQKSPSELESRRHGRGPREGEFVPSHTPHGVPIPSAKLLAQQAAEEKSIKLIERWKAEMPTEQEMLPKDKYSMFDKKVRGYRKGVHKLPKWTRVSQRVNPPGF